VSIITMLDTPRWLIVRYSHTIHPISPSAHNMTNHYFTRSPQNILNLREDTLSQLLTLSNVREGGRYLVVDDTAGLVTAALLERMGSDGRIMIFNESDSPPAWGVLNVMNFSQRELACVKWLNWMEAAEDYERRELCGFDVRDESKHTAPLPEEVDMPSISEAKTLARQRKHMFQTNDLNHTRNELHSGNWDG
jgi:tRNA (adenine-N(1)-)-methyltransferase non-catalytic subunit